MVGNQTVPCNRRSCLFVLNRAPINQNAVVEGAGISEDKAFKGLVGTPIENLLSIEPKRHVRYADARLLALSSSRLGLGEQTRLFFCVFSLSDY